MKITLLILSLLFTFSCTENKEKVITADVSCGQCQFGLKTMEGCDLAIKINGVAYFVDGFHIDDFGDAHHKKTRFYEVIRKTKSKSGRS